MEAEARAKATGLKWIRRKTSRTPIWVASAPGYQPRTVNLSYLRDRPAELIGRCIYLDAEMRAWCAGLHRRIPSFDGTLELIVYTISSRSTQPVCEAKAGNT